MNAVSGTRRAIKELVDGTIRVSVDVDPLHRAAFFALFPDIDMPVALAPLNLDAANEAAAAEPPEEKPKGGALSQVAARMCLIPEFQEWIVERFPEQAEHTLVGALPEDRAASIIRGVCSVRSRAELDHDSSAAATFHAAIRKPWSASGVTR